MSAPRTRRRPLHLSRSAWPSDTAPVISDFWFDEVILGTDAAMIVEEAAALWNARRPDVKVSLEHVGAYAQAAEKLTAALAANTPPDVMLLTVDQHMPAFSRQGALHPLDEFVRVDRSATRAPPPRLLEARSVSEGAPPERRRPSAGSIRSRATSERRLPLAVSPRAGCT